MADDWKDNVLLHPETAPKAQRIDAPQLAAAVDNVIIPHRVVAAAIQDSKGAPPALKGQHMVAKVSGFARLASVVHDLNNNAGPLADTLAEQLVTEANRIKAGMELAKSNVATLKATREGLDALNATFGNGGPPLDGSPPAAPTSKP